MKRIIIVCTVFIAAITSPAMAELQWCDGNWQLELSGSGVLDSGSSDRSGDYMARAMVEYEVPFSSHFTLGLRALPLFVYEQDEHGEETVWGAGAGLGLRLYSVPDEYRGWFAETGAHVLGHKHQISDNDSNINFLTGVGVGYKCKAGWHSDLRFEHISNAGLGSDNSGTNMLSLGIGYRF